MQPKSFLRNVLTVANENHMPYTLHQSLVCFHESKRKKHTHTKLLTSKPNTRLALFLQEAFLFSALYIQTVLWTGLHFAELWRREGGKNWGQVCTTCGPVSINSSYSHVLITPFFGSSAFLFKKGSHIQSSPFRTWEFGFQAMVGHGVVCTAMPLPEKNPGVM